MNEGGRPEIGDRTWATRGGRPVAGVRRPLTGYLFPAVLALGCLISGCAGYQLGTASVFRPEIRTVHVPMFESDTFRRGWSEWLTEAVVKQIERQTPYKVVSDPTQADSVLTGRLLAERKRVLAETKYDDPRDVDLEIVVQVRWVDRRGESMFPTTTFTLAQQAYNVTQNADYIPEAGQSVTSAAQESIEKTARQIVAQMESPW